MTTLGTIKTLLEADSTLLALATGGIYDLTETGPNGINRTTTTAAFDSAGLIKPCILVKLRSSTPDGQIVDNANQLMSLVDMIEIWFFEDGSYSVIESMKNRVYALIHGKNLSGTFLTRWAGDIRGMRDTDLDAFLERSTYQVNLKRSV